MVGESELELEYDFVIVGSGAGGGPLAANLALGGHKVLVVEAGGDETNDNYSVPAFHPSSTEDPLYSWEFYVDHYSENPERDEKYHEAGSYPCAPGIFYPRASTLGGCTGHHAMITVYPGDRDWDRMATLLGDESWSAAHMRKLFERIERAQYRDGSILLRLLEPDETVPDLLARGKDLLRRLTGSAEDEDHGARGTHGGSLGRAVLSDEGDGVSYLMDVHGAVLVRSVAPDRVEVLLPGNEDPEHRFWREFARLEGVLGPDGVATGTWSCAPFDIGPDAGGFEDRLYTAPGTWTLGPSPW